ncbi:MAG: GIY-YIG nuclease family protein [Patescibacteria group bacterium]|jgi:predicted GIY-YIG superfamily endonuclease
MYFVYILKSAADNNLYIGSTDNLDRRIQEHNTGNVNSTKNRRPLKLKCYFVFEERKTAAQFEKYLKTGSGKAFAYKHFNIK